MKTDAIGAEARQADIDFDSSPLPIKRLLELRDSLHKQYVTAKPFPHIYIDNLFDESLVRQILAEFPGKEAMDRWRKFDSEEQKKFGVGNELDIPKFTREFLYYLNSATFISFLEHVTGIEGLIPDPYFASAGLHQSMRGGKLAIHADFNKHNYFNLDRRVNILLYLNENWKDEYGGHLELWDRDMKTCVQKILPIFNRLVIFSTTDYTYHGHPEPMKCPANMSRKSIILYYYSNGRPSDETSDIPHTTLFKNRPGNEERLGWRHTMMKFVPPIVVDIKRWLFP